MAVTFSGLYGLPTWMVYNVDMSALWQTAIFAVALPHLFVGLTITYFLPTITSKAWGYPTTMPEISNDKEDSEAESC